MSMENYHLIYVPSRKVFTPETCPHLPAVSLMTEIMWFLETLQGLQNTYELHCLFFLLSDDKTFLFIFTKAPSS